MFTADVYIDSVQDAQKKIVNQFVTNDTFKKELVKLIDAQTEFVKEQSKTSLGILETVWKNVSEAVYANKPTKTTKASKKDADE